MNDDDWEEIELNKIIIYEQNQNFIIFFFILFYLINSTKAKEPSKLINEIVNEASIILSSSDI